MANTALTLASALIKVADSIKPLLPLLASVAAFRAIRGIGTFVGATAAGLQSGRTFNKGGKVHHFATGGLVPGVGNRDTVPAMLSPGEFVIRKSSVQKLGASNLAGMNRGGEVQRFDRGGKAIIPRSGTPARSNLASLSDDQLSSLSGNTALSRAGASRVANELAKRKKGFENQEKLANVPKFGLVGLFGNAYGPTLGITPKTKTQVSIQGARLNKKESKQYEGIMKSGFIDTIKNIGTKLATSVGARPKLEQGFINDVIKKAGFYNAAGAYLESSLALVGAPFEKDGINSPLDFPSGLGAVSSKFGIASNIPTDVTRTIGSGGKNNSKFLAQVDRYLVKNDLAIKKATGGIIQKFAMGGRAKGIQGAPLVDDILQTSGSILPRPTKAIQDLIKAGGGAVDVDRTLLRTIGDKAYGKAPTSGAKDAALNKYFRDQKNRLQDLKTAPITQFGKELQVAIKSGKLDARKISIASKSQNVRGAREYLSQLFGIPTQNIAFTQGGDKGPFLDAVRKKGSRVDRVSRFATGGGVGTDTVPALLTPGEFVVNRSSAQRIGYGNLNRMNKVGKYANGGIVQRFAGGGTATAPASLQAFNSFFGNSSSSGRASGNASSSQAQATQAATKATNNFGIGISVASGALQAMLPPIDDSSSAMQKFGNSVLGMITTIGGVVFALEGFGVSLTKQNVRKFLSGNSGKDVADSLSRNTGLARRGNNVDLGRFVQRQQSLGYEGVASRSAGRGQIGRLQGSGSDRDILRGLAFERNKSGRLNPGAPRNADISRFLPKDGNIFKTLNVPVRVLGQLFGKLAGPLAVATTAISLFNAAITAFSDAEVRKKKAIESGDVEAAKKAASDQYSLEAGNTGRMALGGGGAVLGFMLGGPIGAAIGAGLGTLIASQAPGLSESISILFGGNTRDSVVALAEAQAQATKTQKAFEQGEKDATKAMEDFNRGTISAADALGAIANVTLEANNLQAANEKAIETNIGNKSKGGLNYVGRGLGSVLSLGYVESQSTRNARIDKENEGLNKSSMDAQRKAFEMRRPMTNEVMRAGILSGKNQAAIDAEIQARGGESATSLRSKEADFKAKARATTDADQAKLFEEGAKLAGDQAKELEDSFKNLTSEIDTAKAKFAAINLGFRSVTAASDAAALRMTNLSQSFEVGALPVQQAAATLEASLTSAGQNISDADFGAALTEVTDTFKQFGASAEQVKDFEDSMKGIAGVQRNFPAIFDQMKNNIENNGFRGMSASDAGKEFKKIVGEQLDGAGIGDDAKKRILDAMGDVQLKPEDLSAIENGDYSVLEKYLGDAGEEASKVLKGVIDNLAKMNQVLIDVTKQRIEAERNLLEAQKEALSLTMEGRELQGKYGGRVVTNEERRQNVLARANVNSSGSGLSNMKTGSLAELRTRNAELISGFANIEEKRKQPNGMKLAEGVKLDEQQKDLQKAQKDQINTIRELVKLEEENLKLIGEKNKLEKDSIDALVAGDIDKFMQTQATVGATAAIATGNKSLMGAFGPEALGLAAQDIRRQQEAGVQSLYGTQLAGQGGLTQQAFGSALSARGVTDPRLAQVASGTTAEEEASKARLRDFGTALGEAGKVGENMAAMQLDTAEMRVQQATINIEKAAQGGVAPVAKANGGLIYANRGMFIPRGTDTVPAMLTPGEFVVRREAVNRGNNLQLLQQMNGAGGGMTSSSAVMGFARGGRVQYYAEGGVSSSSGSGESFEKLTQALTRVMGYVNGVAESIKSLPTTISHQIADTKVDVNVMGGNMLNAFADNLENRVMGKVSEKLKNSYPTENGIQNNGSVLG
jgi:hypothetical protein